MAETTLKRHPVRGFVWGIVAGLGIGLLLMVLSIVPLSIPTLVVYTAAAAVSGLVWGIIGPPRKPKGDAPHADATVLPPEAPDGDIAPAAT
jgi:hypothetical protein